ncbi:hypothetical protein AWM75_06520 [Aerococcus urinaehominis]|uniref:Uncharacterized protein n=1 Tax=Aerococcus urinaehominis TaxID=128944 RepID=A0A120IAZ5_9LACT|nr:DUF3397 family protein [Aerococcus urinaehominis]AMB99654.1 hypothetical protein AWM75_06520 [Aerococcus urinaehominis]SDL89111.1 Protein of unknown function [Aerococcus urinaehominis]
MQVFSWSELILYFMPIISLVVVNGFLRPYLKFGDRLNLAVIDVLHPILWVAIHILSLRIAYQSWLPYLFIFVAIYALAYLLYAFYAKRDFIPEQFWRRLSSIGIIAGFIFFYALVIWRLIRLIFNTF